MYLTVPGFIRGVLTPLTLSGNFALLVVQQPFGMLSNQGMAVQKPLPCHLATPQHKLASKPLNDPEWSVHSEGRGAGQYSAAIFALRPLPML